MPTGAVARNTCKMGRYIRRRGERQARNSLSNLSRGLMKSVVAVGGRKA